VTVRAWRIVKAKHARLAFTGEGAKQAGGRWSSPGVAAVCVAGSMSLAMLEVLVHVKAPELLTKYVAFEVTFDDSLITRVNLKKLPRAWKQSPPPPAVQQIGDAWVAEETSPVLRVPSVIVRTEWNYLLNPAHPEFDRITRGPREAVKFDPRLAKTQK